MLPSSSLILGLGMLEMDAWRNTTRYEIWTIHISSGVQELGGIALFSTGAMALSLPPVSLVP